MIQTHARDLKVGDKLIGHGMIVGIRWPLGGCLSCGCLVNIETDEGHDPSRHRPAAPPSKKVGP